MKIQVYVDRLFQDYEDTPELRDFKEEIKVNLQERVKEFQSKGLSPEAAFEQAIAELGDITEIAEEISKQKRNEVISRMYFRSSPPMSKKHAIGYVLAGGTILFGLLVALIVYISTGEIFTAIATQSLPFFALPVAVLVFLRLTQETSWDYPMPWKRAFLYAVVTSIILFGLGTSVMLYFMPGQELQAVFGTLIAFVVPSLCLLTYLVLTEKKRHKPWVAEELRVWEEYYAKDYSDPRQMEQKGLLIGALWIFAAALFILFGFLIGFRYSWVIFLFAIAGILLIEYWMGVKE